MPAPDMTPVHSSHVDSVGYDATAQEMHVRWDSGKTSIYSGVPAELADEVLKSWSVGSALTEKVKSAFSHRYAS